MNDNIQINTDKPLNQNVKNFYEIALDDMWVVSCLVIKGESQSSWLIIQCQKPWENHQKYHFSIHNPNGFGSSTNCHILILRKEIEHYIKREKMLLAPSIFKNLDNCLYIYTIQFKIFFVLFTWKIKVKNN